MSVTKYNGTTYSGLALAHYTGILPSGAFSMRVDESVNAQKIDLLATVGGIAKPLLSGSTNATTPPLATSNTLTVGVQDADFRFEYFLVIETMP